MVAKTFVVVIAFETTRFEERTKVDTGAKRVPTERVVVFIVVALIFVVNMFAVVMVFRT